MCGFCVNAPEFEITYTLSSRESLVTKQIRAFSPVYYLACLLKREFIHVRTRLKKEFPRFSCFRRKLCNCVPRRFRVCETEFFLTQEGTITFLKQV